MDVLQLAKSENKELFTSAELAEKFGMSKSNMDLRIRKLGLKPVVPAIDIQHGRKPALYNLEAFTKIKEEEEEAILVAKKKALVEKHVNALTEEEQGFVVTKQIEALYGRHDKAAMKEKAIAAAAMVQSLLADAAFYENEYDEILKGNEEYRKQLDISTSMCTVETYAINKRIPCTRAKAGSITRKLHQAGYQDEGKIPSKYDNNLPATVWKIEILDAAYQDGMFE